MRVWRNLEKNRQLLKEAARSGAFIVFDTETTGLKAEDQIVEFAGFKCLYKNGEFCHYDVLHLYIKPDRPMPEEVTEINGLTDEFLSDKMSEREAFPIIRDFLGDAPVLGAYNSGFDVKMLSGMYDRCGSRLNVGLEVDLLKIARDIFCERALKNHKLSTIANTYGVDEGISFHSAKDDVIVLIRVLNAMLRDIKENGADGNEFVRVFRLNFYKGYRGKSRLYCITSRGPVYYDFMSDKWMPGDEKIDLEKINMQDFENQVFSKAGCFDYRELRKKSLEGAFTYQKKEQAV